MAATLEVRIVGNATSAVSAMKETSSAAQSTASTAEKSSSSFGRVAKAIASAYVVKKVVDFGVSAVESAEKAAVANNRLITVFRNAGDSTGRLAQHAIELARNFGEQAGISPSVIKGAEGILAAFKNVGSQTGVNSGVFDRATKAAADLAAAGFGSLTGNAKSLGKALNDPIKYMGGLARAGVTLTASQREQIKTMVEHGNLLGAQKQLLSDVEARVGGMAEGTATASSKMKVAFGAMKTSIGTALLPLVDKLAPSVTKFFDFMSRNSDVFTPIAVGVLAVAAAITVATIAMAAFDAVGGWVGVLVVAIIALVAVIVYLATKTQFFQTIWNAIWAAVVQPVLVFVSWLVAAWNAMWAAVTAAVSVAVAWIVATWSGIVAVASSVVSSVARFFSGVLGYISTPFISAYNTVAAWVGRIPGIASSVVSAVARFFSGVLGYVSGPFISAYNTVSGWLGRIPGLASSVVSSVGRFFSGVARSVSSPFVSAYNTVSSWLGRIPGIASSAAGSVGRFFSGVTNAIISPFRSAVSWVGSLPGQIGGIMSRVTGAVAGAVSGVFNAIISPFRAAYNWVQANVIGPIRGAWNSVARVINSIQIRTPEVRILGHTIVPSFAWSPPRIPYLARGGLITREGLAYVHAAEVITPAANLVAGAQNVHVDVTVNVPATAHPAETGRAVATALRSFFAAGGRLTIPTGV